MYRLLLLVFVAFSGSSNLDQMAWDEDYKLQWSDFRAQPSAEVDAVAITASGLSSTFSARTSPDKLLDYSATIVAHFYPQQSWYKPERVNEIVLAHEQLHFDITELHARQLRRDIANYKFTLDIKAEMKYLQNVANEDLEAMQERYDNETNYSINVSEQKTWQIFIREELNKLDAYK